MDMPTDTHEEVHHATTFIRHLSGTSDEVDAVQSAVDYYSRDYASLMVLGSKIEAIVQRDGNASTFSHGLSLLKPPLQTRIQARIANAVESVNTFKGNTRI